MELSESERQAELQDTTETVAHCEGALIVARHNLTEQLTRSRSVYGERMNWPADSEMAARQHEAKVAELVERRDAAVEYTRELRG